MTPTSSWKNVLRLDNGKYVRDNIPLKDTYVKASDVQFVENSVKLNPSNTAAEAQAAAVKK